MRTEIEESRARPPIVRRAAAGLILIAAVALAIHVVFHLILTVIWVIVGVAVVFAILWALKTLA